MDTAGRHEIDCPNNPKRPMQEVPEVKCTVHYVPDVRAEWLGKTPHRCPVCGGKCIVPAGFYDRVGVQWNVADREPETCRACNGKGIVWS